MNPRERIATNMFIEQLKHIKTNNYQGVSFKDVTLRKEERCMSERFPGIDWYCDLCNACLNDQLGFDDHHYVWKCTECGHKNSISSDDIYDSEEDFRNPYN